MRGAYVTSGSQTADCATTTMATVRGKKKLGELTQKSRSNERLFEGAKARGSAF
jgi:hypothetical protein